MKYRRAFTLIEIMIVVAIIGLLAAIAIPSLLKSMETARKNACGMNRKNIEGAKVAWALENKKPMDAIPTDEDLFGTGKPIDHKPDCPASGVYSLNAVDQKCTCSVATHIELR